MKYLSIDIETTGLNPEADQILSIGIILENTANKLSFNDIPKLHLAILNDRISGSPFAINMNAELIKTINSYQCAKTDEERDQLSKNSGMQFVSEDIVSEIIYHFLYINGIGGDTFEDVARGRQVKVVDGHMVPAITLRTKPTTITVAGKNFGTFDKLFLEKLLNWERLIRIQQRIIDPAVLFVDWNTDETLPNLPLCKSRSGLPEFVSHNAVEDAWDVIQVLRTRY